MSEQNQQQQIPEEPIFLIERDNVPDDIKEPTSPKPKRRPWLRWLWGALVLGILALLTFMVYRSYYGRQFDPDTPVSATPEENIEKLQQQAPNEPAEVVMTSDSILGVGLNFYAIHGAKASLEWVEPDTLDKNVILYCRSADHKADSLYLGALVVKGEEKDAYEGRTGYMAMTDRRFVIGVAETNEVKDYIIEQGGSFFRQMVLVSNGMLPKTFELHGKVERRAIGRIGEQYYFVVTRTKETMWDFADALREYGFLDAIYITGGGDYCFYRTRDGQKHDIGDVANYPHKKWKGIIPWLVFRK